MTEIDFRTAIRQALDEGLERDERLVFYGEDVAAAGGAFQVTPGLLERHGPERVFDTPISELALAGSAFGSAVTGLRPVIEIMFGDFLPLTMDRLVNQGAKYWYLANEQASIHPRDVAGGTFIVTNLGMYGVSPFSPIINPPQAAILAAGAAGQRAVAEDGTLVPRQFMTLTLCGDHRMVNGADVVAFLGAVRDRLQDPYGLVG